MTNNTNFLDGIRNNMYKSARDLDRFIDRLDSLFFCYDVIVNPSDGHTLDGPGKYKQMMESIHELKQASKPYSAGPVDPYNHKDRPESGELEGPHTSGSLWENHIWFTRLGYPEMYVIMNTARGYHNPSDWYEMDFAQQVSAARGIWESDQTDGIPC